MLEIFLHTIIALLPIVNPIGIAPIFLNMTEGASKRERHVIAFQVALYSFLLLFITLLIGHYILTFFGLKISYIDIAGGYVVFHTAWEMLTSKERLSKSEKEAVTHWSKSILFFPLTMPITAGAGCIAVTLSIGAHILSTHPTDTTLIENYTAAAAGIFVVALLIYLCYGFAQSIFKLLGQVGTNVVSKLAAFILLAIGVEIIWNGILALITSLH